MNTYASLIKKNILVVSHQSKQYRLTSLAVAVAFRGYYRPDTPADLTHRNHQLQMSVGGRRTLPGKRPPYPTAGTMTATPGRSTGDRLSRTSIGSDPVDLRTCPVRPVEANRNP